MWDADKGKEAGGRVGCLIALALAVLPLLVQIVLWLKDGYWYEAHLNGQELTYTGWVIPDRIIGWILSFHISVYILLIGTLIVVPITSGLGYSLGSLLDYFKKAG